MSDPNANKEKWAAKNQGRTLHPDEVANAHVERPRLPPGQHIPNGWPILDLGITPPIHRLRWQLKAAGLVERPQIFEWEQLLDLPQTEQICDFHCVTTWSTYDNNCTGVRFSDFAKHVGVQPEARFVYFLSYDKYTTNLDLECCMDSDVMLMHAWNGKPLDAEHGGPVRMLVPKRYLWKSAKWVKEIHFM